MLPIVFQSLKNAPNFKISYMAPGSPLMVFKEAVDYAEEEGKAWKTETAYSLIIGNRANMLKEIHLYFNFIEHSSMACACLALDV